MQIYYLAPMGQEFDTHLTELISRCLEMIGENLFPCPIQLQEATCTVRLLVLFSISQTAMLHLFGHFSVITSLSDNNWERFFLRIRFASPGQSRLLLQDPNLFTSSEPFCHITKHLHRLWELGHEYLWGVGDIFLTYLLVYFDELG